MEKIEQVEKIFAEIDRETQAFAGASGIRCRAGCGDCCYVSIPEVRVVEMLPLAAQILDTNTEDLVLARLQGMESGRCAFYAANPSDASLGKCSVYAKRPGVCRLFGYAAVRNKRGDLDLASCHWQKKLQPEALEKVKREITCGTQAIPAFYQFDQEFLNLVPSGLLSELFPINQALVCALEYLALIRQVREEAGAALLLNTRQ